MLAIKVSQNSIIVEAVFYLGGLFQRGESRFREKKHITCGAKNPNSGSWRAAARAHRVGFGTRNFRVGMLWLRVRPLIITRSPSEFHEKYISKERFGFGSENSRTRRAPHSIKHYVEQYRVRHLIQ